MLIDEGGLLSKLINIRMHLCLLKQYEEGAFDSSLVSLLVIKFRVSLALAECLIESVQLFTYLIVLPHLTHSLHIGKQKLFTT